MSQQYENILRDLIKKLSDELQEKTQADKIIFKKLDEHNDKIHAQDLKFLNMKRDLQQLCEDKKENIEKFKAKYILIGVIVAAIIAALGQIISTYLI